MIVTSHIKFGLHSNFLDSMLQAEDERLPGETVEDGTIRVYKKLENAVERLKKEHEAMRGVQETYPQPYPDPNRFHKMTSGQLPPTQVTFTPTPEINIQHERIEIEIENLSSFDHLGGIEQRAVNSPLKDRYYKKGIELARTMAELSIFKTVASVDKDLYNAYNQRVKELTNG